MKQLRQLGLLLLLFSCGNEQQQSIEERQIITDQLGREVRVKQGVERVVSGNMMAHVPAHYVANQSVATVKGMHPTAQRRIKNSILGVMEPALLLQPNQFFSNGALNIEQLLMLNPDVYIENAQDRQAIDKLSEVGVPTVALQARALHNGDPIETFISWLDLITLMHGASERSDSFKNQAYSTLAMINEELMLIKQAYPRVLYLQDHDVKVIRAAGSHTFGSNWIGTTGGINVGDGVVTGNQEVSMEQIYLWNPEVIILSSTTQTDPQNFLDNSITGQDWSLVSAVQSGRVHKIPLGISGWGAPSGDAPLMLKWMAQLMHPDLFAYDIIEEIQQYYQEFYDYPLTAEQARAILDPALAPWQVS